MMLRDAGVIAAEAGAVGVVRLLLMYLMYSSILLGAAWLLSLACRARADVRDVVWKAAIVLSLVVTGAQAIGIDGRADRAGTPSFVPGALPDVVLMAVEDETGAAETGSLLRQGPTMERLRSASIHLTLNRGWVFALAIT